MSQPTTPDLTLDPIAVRRVYGSGLRMMFLWSLTAFTAAFLISTLTHEGAHALVAWQFGLHPVMHHNYVQTPAGAPALARLWVPAAGPLASLFSAVVFLTWAKVASRPSLVTLTALWLGLHGAATFFGYLAIGPVVRQGDTGKIYAELGTAIAVQWLVAAVAFVSMIVVFRAAAGIFARFAIRVTADTERPRLAIATSLIALPAVAGSALAVMLSLPAPTSVSLAYPLVTGILAFAAFGSFRRNRDPLPAGMTYATAPLFAALLVVAVLVAVSLILTPGVRL